MSTFTEHLKNTISNVIIACGIREAKYSVNAFNQMGQNYFGVLIPMDLSGNINETPVTLHLVMKYAPIDERSRVSGAVTLFYEKEIFAYTTLFESYERLQVGFPPECLLVFPTRYYISKELGKEVIVMRDMRFEGYLISTTKYLDYNHIVVSLNSLANFHALSYILRIKHSEKFEDFSKVCQPLNQHTNPRFINILEDRLDKALTHFENTQYSQFLQDIRDNCIEYINKIYTSVHGIAICHGDIWKENILYKYVDNKPMSACLIDYQTARLSSPAFDVLYLIVTSTDIELRTERYYDMLRVYYQKFRRTLMSAQLQAESIYSIDQLITDAKVCAPAAFIIANTAAWLSSGMQQEGPVKSKIVVKTEEDKIKATNRYKDAVTSILDYYMNTDHVKL